MQTHVENRLIEIIMPLIVGMGYEVVHVEVQAHRQKILRLFIDFAEATDHSTEKVIGIEDCVKVARALDEPLDQNAEIERLFHGAYELEVSSPGVDRPLRQKKDFKRFEGKLARVHTFRSLSEEEIGNAGYFAKNPKQKNFIGVLKGVAEDQRGDRVLLSVGDQGSDQGSEHGSEKKGKKKTKSGEADEPSGQEITIPLSLVSKANLEPVFEFEQN